MRKWIVAAMLAVVAAGVPEAFAQTWPSRPITLIAPFPAGGPLDSIARVIAEPMREALGQPVVIENMAGAGGNLGVGRVARSEPDGYTVVIGQWSTHVVNPVTYTLPYDVREMEPIGLLTITPQLIIARTLSGSLARSTSSGTLVCMRNAISYCARRALTSGSSTQSGCASVSAFTASITSRCCVWVVPSGSRR